MKSNNYQFKLNTREPKDILTFIKCLKQIPKELRETIYFDYKNIRFRSTSKLIDVFFDPYHCVLEINIFIAVNN